MLSNEHRMPLEWRLPAVIDGRGRREPPIDEIGGMRKDCVHPSRLEIRPLFRRERKPAPERGTLERDEEIAQIAHSFEAVTELK